MGEAAPKLRVEQAKGEQVHKRSVKDQILDRRTPELVFGFCGAIGSGVSTVAKEVGAKFKSYGYHVEIIKISKLIELLKSKLQESVDDKWYEKFGGNAHRVAYLQEAGNALRKQYSNNVLAQVAIAEISSIRTEKYLSKEAKEKLAEKKDPIEKNRVVWIVDSLKNPEEVEAFRFVYGNMFYLIGVLCPVEGRRSRLVKKPMSEGEASLLIDKDKSEPVQYGQKLIETIQESDFFVDNSNDNLKNIRESADRFLGILFGQNISPTNHEYAMQIAQTSAYQSSCLSRQVGAVIMGINGNIVATGYNDAPKAGGGLYRTEDDKDDKRCFTIYGERCISDRYKSDLQNKIALCLSGLTENDEERATLAEKIFKDAELKNITEFCRAVHAEMDAITTASRILKNNLDGCSMFVTTYPCHNCAKHIVASGIREVFYIEPYEKSLAMALHDDAISQDSGTKTNKVRFYPFQGIAPRQFQKFFSIHGKRKEFGRSTNIDMGSAIPISEKFLDTYTSYESKIWKSLREMNLSDILAEKGGAYAEPQEEQRQ